MHHRRDLISVCSIGLIVYGSAGATELEAPKYNCETPYNGGLGQSPQRGRGAESLVRGLGDEALLKLKHF